MSDSLTGWSEKGSIHSHSVCYWGAGCTRLLKRCALVTSVNSLAHIETSTSLTYVDLNVNITHTVSATCWNSQHHAYIYTHAYIPTTSSTCFKCVTNTSRPISCIKMLPPIAASINTAALLSVAHAITQHPPWCKCPPR